jgi:hypothetical protein
MKNRSIVIPVGILLAAVLIFLGCEPASDGRSSTGPIDTGIYEILREPDGLVRMERLAAFLRGAQPEDVDQVIAGFDRSFLDRGDVELVLLVDWWSRFDPDGATDWAKTSWRAEHPRVQYAIVRRVAARDPERALELFRREVGPKLRDFSAHLEGLIVGWYESGQSGLIAFIQSQPSLELRQQSFGTLGRLVVLEKGIEDAIRWAEAIGPQLDIDSQRYVNQRVASSIAEVDPEAAGRWVKTLIAEGHSQTLLRRVAGRWSKSDPEAAFAWLGEFPVTPHQKQAVSQTFIYWFVRDPMAAEEWLRTQGDAIGTWLAPATARMTKTKAEIAHKREVGSTDWVDLLELAMRIEDEHDRWGAVGTVARFWVKEDPEATDAWMEANDVPQLYRDKVHGRPPTGPIPESLKR